MSDFYPQIAGFETANGSDFRDAARPPGQFCRGRRRWTGPAHDRLPGSDGRPAGVDQPRIEAAVREILLAIGEDPRRDGLADTPRRVARAYCELFGGLREDAGRHLARTFEHDSDELVIVGGIPFASMCEHHMLPFMGHAHLAYLPANGRVVGLSKLARTVDVFARRPQMQERLSRQIADALEEHLRPRGVCVVLEAEHLCMRLRGACKPGAVTRTLAVRGVYRDDAAARAEVLGLMRGRS
ncbi:MAG: GTP cyclohydrolase I FolE [Phycisphaerales bacterium]|nr:GTP cyclohydrolase I FolE [Phycisphaerales bacterium]